MVLGEEIDRRKFWACSKLRTTGWDCYENFQVSGGRMKVAPPVFGNRTTNRAWLSTQRWRNKSHDWSQVIVTSHAIGRCHNDHMHDRSLLTKTSCTITNTSCTTKIVIDRTICRTIGYDQYLIGTTTLKSKQFSGDWSCHFQIFVQSRKFYSRETPCDLGFTHTIPPLYV